MLQDPSFVMESLGGLFGGCSGAPFFFTGFVQYFSNIPSLSHFCRDRCNDSTKTPLSQAVKLARLSNMQIAGQGRHTFLRRSEIPSRTGSQAEVLQE